MQKTLLKKVLSIILAMVTTITISGCNKNHKKTNDYMPMSIEQLKDSEETSFLDAWILTRNSFFDDFSILNEMSENNYSISEIDSCLAFLKVDYRFDSAYNFFNHFINYYVEETDAKSESLYSISNFIKTEKGVGYYSADIEFENFKGIYNMSFIDKSLTVEGINYKSVSQKFQDDDMIFKKSLTFKEKKSGGPKSFKSEASYSQNYELTYYNTDPSSNITIILSREGVLQTSSEIEEVCNKTYLYYFYGNKLIEHKKISQSDFYSYTCIIYESYLNGINKDSFLRRPDIFIKIRKK
ncbi:MAG: hypothetical protein IJA94_04405 [Bacilli bacterium]|nr:hypothetical protein [Bacilli bacterium]